MISIFNFYFDIIDLKPENLLLKTNEDDSIIKLCDFGFAKEAHEGLTTPK
jgi:serine/threonine protein kinase